MEIPIVRRANDLFISVTLTDAHGNRVDWFALSNIKALIYSREQRVDVGSCELGEIIDGALQLKYDARINYQYLGVNDLVLMFEKDGEIMTRKKPLVEFVPFSYMAARYIPDKIEIDLMI